MFNEMSILTIIIFLIIVFRGAVSEKPNEELFFVQTKTEKPGINFCNIFCVI